MPNPNCVCEMAGYCQRHQINKSDHLHQMCKGIAPTVDCGRKYWIAWEQGMLGATRPADPVVNPDHFCLGVYTPPLPTTPTTPAPRGFGDVIASALSAVGITEERVSAWVGGECQCAARKAKLNRLGAWAASFLKGTPTEEITTMINGTDKKNET